MQEAFKAGTLQREDLFVTTKLWNTNHRPERVKPAFDASRRRLQLDDIDCYIIHTPFAFQPGDEQDPRDEHGQVIYDSGVTLAETWRALERLVDEGHCKSIGLSDITLEKLREIVAVARIRPAMVQVESHPYLPEWELLDFCREHGIVLQAFAALGHAMEPNVLADPVITAIAQRVHKTPAQVALAWAVQRGTAFLTTSTNPRRIQENFDISALPEDAMREMRDASRRMSGSTRWSRPACPGLFRGLADLTHMTSRRAVRSAIARSDRARCAYRRCRQPSVNGPQTLSRMARASALWPAPIMDRARLIAQRSSQKRAPCWAAMSMASRKCASASSECRALLSINSPLMRISSGRYQSSCRSLQRVRTSSITSRPRSTWSASPKHAASSPSRGRKRGRKRASPARLSSSRSSGRPVATSPRLP